MSCTDTGRMLATLAHLAAVRTGSEGAVLHHALYAALLAAELHLAPAEADDRAAEPARDEAEHAISTRARDLIEQARTAARREEFTPATTWTPVVVVPERQFAVGDTVRLRITQSGTWIDENLADEEGEENARVGVTVRAGRVGRVTVVCSWPTPFPYVVMFGDQEIGVPEEALERVATVWTPSVGDVVTHTGIDGTWVVERVRDEDAVWARRSGRCEEPELLAVAELRPAELVQGGAR